MAKRLALPVRRSMNLTEPVYERLRALNAEYGLGNNYLLTVLLENLDEFADTDKLKRIFAEFVNEFGAPAPGSMKK